MRATGVALGKLHSGYHYEPDGSRSESKSPNLHDLSASASAYGKAGAGFRLTPRQIEFLQLLADGKTIFDTALCMGITRSMAKQRAAHVRERMDVETTIHAVATALRLGIIT